MEVHTQQTQGSCGANVCRHQHQLSSEAIAVGEQILTYAACFAPRNPFRRRVSMGSACALLVSLAVCSVAGIAQSKLPDADHTWVVGAKKMRQRNNQAPLEITLHSGVRIAVPPQDVHEYGTSIIRSAMMKQANPSVPVALLFVLQIRGTAPVGNSDVDVTLASGTVVRVRAGDVNDVRLTFLRTALAEARSTVTSVGSAP